MNKPRVLAGAPLAALFFSALFAVPGGMPPLLAAAGHENPPQETGDLLLAGTVRGPDGRAMEGVTVSAHLTESPVVVTVFSDAHGRYYFPALTGGGRYEVAAQAVGYQRALSRVTVAPGVAKADFTLAETGDFLNQLSGWQQGESLPETTREDRRGKAMVLKTCSSCHQSSRLFQRRYDAKGWEGLITAMPFMFVGTDKFGPAALQRHKDELAAYLERVSGPKPFPITIGADYRPKGDALNAVIYTYSIPNADGQYNFNLGHDWQQGNPVTTGVGTSIHDATVDMDGNPWFTSPVPISGRTIGRIDAVTGKTTSYAYPGFKGGTAFSHAIVTAPDGKIWFTNATGPNLLSQEIGFMDPQTREARSFPVPAGMIPVSGWLNIDGKGGIWTSTGSASGNEGVLHFSIATKKYTQYRSLRNGMTYGVAGDRDGNGWWALVNEDVIGHVDQATGIVQEIVLPFTWEGATFLEPGDMTKDEYIGIQSGIGDVTAGNSQMPRRMKADLNADAVWVANFAGNSLMRIDTKTKKVEFFPLPHQGMNPYDVGIDSEHRVWVGIQNGDEIARFDPATRVWTIFPMPIKGLSPRSLSVVERPGQLEVVVPATDAHAVVRLIPRTASQVAALKSRYQAAGL